MLAVLKKAFSLFIPVLVISCDMNVNETLVNYSIINQSGATVRLKSFDISRFEKTRSDIVILDNDTYSESIIINAREDNTNSFSALFKSDSVVVVFNSTRRLIYYFTGTSFESNVETTSRNILTVGPDTNTDMAEYIFTVDDFSVAIPCEGEDCE